MIVGLASSPAEASTPATSAPQAAAAAVTINSSFTGGVLVAERVAATTTSSTTSSAAAAKKAAAHKAAAKKAAAHKAAAKRAAARKAAAKKAAAKKAAAHKAAAKKAAKKQAAAAITLGQRVIRVASTYKGRPYQWGATGPSRFDCSGFTRFIYAKFGISLPHSSAGQYSVVRHVANRDKRIGDLVFFHSGSGHVYHVGIYAGGDVIWAATHTGDFVRLEGMWNASYYVGRV
jgi:cell wall-associated NlpC family hydrolase